MERQAAHQPRGRHDRRLGARAAATSRPTADLQAFSDELTHLLVHQKAAFNSPVWFNVRHRGAPAVLGLLHQLGRGHDGLDPRRWPRPRACSSSTARAPARTSRRIRSSTRDARRRRHGLRARSRFMKGYDAFAGVIKSGGKTRRAAKMVILNADHPDIVEFINCKVDEEKKAWALIDAGYDGSFNGDGLRLGLLPEREQLACA
ncbi:MAG: hypothetical protein MZV64_13885 [Ignavibacteriales bacterium]|nr:hypothetical protein [Ignavibacteriales bacterium]